MGSLCEWKYVFAVRSALSISANDIEDWFPKISENGSLSVVIDFFDITISLRIIFRKGIRWHKPTLDKFREQWASVKDKAEKQQLIDEYIARKRAIEEVSCGCTLDWRYGTDSCSYGVGC